eukprot:TRINITY_DN6894_c0_g1_i8.p1 TRINITY_DN6894_c0_g1~~TRINITY_DN6894_c0_g1_i8.p1  ORF type:complete len:175 (-),score=70.10 TRINITY_DN6894_c0_g1_i8:2-526(-)
MVLLTTILAIFLKQNKYLRTVTQLIPESGMMLFFGVIVALIMHGIDSSLANGHMVDPIQIPHTIIQHVLIAPIILHASYELYHPHFFGQRPINWKWQILIIVGGLRGAISFAMVVTYEGPFHKIFYDTTLVVIFFTTIANGIITKPLVTSLGLKAEAGVQTDYGLVVGDKAHRG